MAQTNSALHGLILLENKTRSLKAGTSSNKLWLPILPFSALFVVDVYVYLAVFITACLRGISSHPLTKQSSRGKFGSRMFQLRSIPVLEPLIVHLHLI